MESVDSTGYKLNIWKGRRALLIKFQEELLANISGEDYNVYVFGSYIRADFNSEKSDIDMIVYCADTLKRWDIVLFCEKFFQEHELFCDILEYSFMPDAYIFAVGILNSVHLTGFYPQILKNELYIIAKNYSYSLKEEVEKKKHMSWSYKIKKTELNKKGEVGDNGRNSRRNEKIRF